MAICTLKVSGDSFDVERFAASAPFECGCIWKKGHPAPSVIEMMTGKRGSPDSKLSNAKNSGFRVTITKLDTPQTSEEVIFTAQTFLESNREGLLSLRNNPTVENMELSFDFFPPSGKGPNARLASVLLLPRKFVQLAAEVGVEIEVTVWNSEMTE